MGSFIISKVLTLCRVAQMVISFAGISQAKIEFVRLLLSVPLQLLRSLMMKSISFMLRDTIGAKA
jgi:hypothetical protein